MNFVALDHAELQLAVERCGRYGVPVGHELYACQSNLIQTSCLDRSAPCGLSIVAQFCFRTGRSNTFGELSLSRRPAPTAPEALTSPLWVDWEAKEDRAAEGEAKGRFIFDRRR
jgi:hypothetical protein